MLVCATPAVPCAAVPEAFAVTFLVVLFGVLAALLPELELAVFALLPELELELEVLVLLRELELVVFAMLPELEPELEVVVVAV